MTSGNSGSSNDERTRGIFTESDSEWLNDDDNSSVRPSDQKRRLQKGLALAIEDIQSLVDDGFEASNLDNIGELFDRTEDQVDISRTESAKYLIALAFIITNDPIDYSEIAEEMVTHPRDVDESPTDEDRTQAGGPINFNQPVDQMLSFREALTGGIKLGKQHYKNAENIPDTVLIDANTRLYKEPTVDQLKARSTRESTENWLDIVAQHLDADGRPGGPAASAEHIDPSEAPKYLKHEIEFNIEQRLSRRRQRSNHDVLQRKLDF